MKRSTVLLFFALLSCKALQAQDSLNFWQRFMKKQAEKAEMQAEKFDNYTVLGISAVGQQFQDTRMSPGIYTGIGGGIRQSFWRMDSNSISRFRTDLSFTFPGLESGFNEDYQSFLYSQDYMFVGKTGWLSGNLYIGGSIDAIDHFRNHSAIGNSSLNNDLAFALQPTLLWWYPTNWKGRSSWLYAELHGSLVNARWSSPTYSVSHEPSWSFGTIGQYNRWRLMLGYSWLRKWSKENRFGLSYSFDVLAFNRNENLFQYRFVQHSISFNWWMKTR